MRARTPVAERRQWSRLPLAIPVFVRSRPDANRETGPDTDRDKEFLEFATALNVSAGGMLLAVRRPLPSSAEISLEIPSAPLAALASLPHAARTLRAKVLRIELGQTFHLVGLKFSQPLLHSAKAVSQKRKRLSPM